MATKDVQVTTTSTGGVSLLWAALAQGDDGRPADYENYADRTVQITGVFDGETVQLVGSLDGVNHAPLTDQRGDEINVSGADLKLVAEATPWVKPVVNGGGAATDINVSMYLRRK